MDVLNMENKKIENKKINFEKINLESLEKKEKYILFLLEIENKNICSKKEIEDLYLNKYKLNKSSNKINFNNFNRFFGIDNKYNDEEKKEKIIKLKEELKSININYSDLINIYRSKIKSSDSGKRIYNNYSKIENLKKLL